MASLLCRQQSACGCVHRAGDGSPAADAAETVGGAAHPAPSCRAAAAEASCARADAFAVSCRAAASADRRLLMLSLALSTIAAFTCGPAGRRADMRAAVLLQL